MRFDFQIEILIIRKAKSIQQAIITIMLYVTYSLNNGYISTCKCIC